jgi:hypothetical protein
MPSTTPPTSTALVPVHPPLNKIQTHPLDAKLSSPTDPILAIDLEPIPKPIKDCILVTILEESPLMTPLPVDIVNNALPKHARMSRNALHRAIGFQSPIVLLKNIHKLGTKLVHVYYANKRKRGGEF